MREKDRYAMFRIKGEFRDEIFIRSKKGEDQKTIKKYIKEHINDLRYEVIFEEEI